MNSSSIIDGSKNLKNDPNLKHFESLEEIKTVIGSEKPGLTKDQLYDEMLKPYSYLKQHEMDPATGKQRIVYT
jgi:hypothetical protein